LIRKLLEAESVPQASERASASVVYPRPEDKTNPILRYLDEAKEHIDVIDFRKSRWS
jgi:hypothetical protein